MPKKLDHMQNKILECAKKKMFEEGLNNVCLRSIAQECNIAVGTIYNYFKNKDMLIASIMYEDWQISLEKVDCEFEKISSIEEGFLIIYREIKEFIHLYCPIWKQSEDSTSSAYSRHYFVLEHISERINILLNKYSMHEEKCMSIILSECILSCVLHKQIEENEYLYFIKRIFKD